MRSDNFVGDYSDLPRPHAAKGHSARPTTAASRSRLAYGARAHAVACAPMLWRARSAQVRSLTYSKMHSNPLSRPLDQGYVSAFLSRRLQATAAWRGHVGTARVRYRLSWNSRRNGLNSRFATTRMGDRAVHCSLAPGGVPQSEVANVARL
jgi:hypothetical protein